MLATRTDNFEYSELYELWPYRLGMLFFLFVLIAYCLGVFSLLLFNSLNSGLLLGAAALLSSRVVAFKDPIIGTASFSLAMFFRNLLWLSVCCVFTVIFATLFLDTSYDGQMHHQEALLQLASSWNPYRQEFLTEQALGVGMERVVLFLNHYPKFSWLFGALIYEAFPNIEAAKAVNLLIFAATGLLCFAAIKDFFRCSTAKSIFYALCLALNPITIVQLLNGYIDGLLGCFVLLLFIFSGWYLKHAKTLFLAGAAGSAIAVINLKFTGLVYAVLLLGLLSLSILVFKHPYRRSYCVGAALALLLGFSLFGYQPYVKSFLEKGTPIYPVTSYPLSGVTPAQETLIQQQLPEDFIKADRFTKLFRSLFSRSENVARPDSSRRKLPWQIETREIQAFASPDVRVGGFGPLFALIVVLTLSLIVLALIFRVPQFSIACLTAALLLVSALANPEAWWARYVPQLWLIPNVIAIFVCETSKNRSLRSLSAALLALLFINSSLIAASYLSGQFSSTAAARAQLQRLSAAEKPIAVTFGHFRALRARLEAFEIDFRETSSLDCPAPSQLFYSSIRFCKE